MSTATSMGPAECQSPDHNGKNPRTSQAQSVARLGQIRASMRLGQWSTNCAGPGPLRVTNDSSARFPAKQGIVESSNMSLTYPPPGSNREVPPTQIRNRFARSTSCHHRPADGPSPWPHRQGHPHLRTPVAGPPALPTSVSADLGAPTPRVLNQQFVRDHLLEKLSASGCGAPTEHRRG